MGNKDKGGRNTKKTASKGLKEKRAAKKAKRGQNEGNSNQTIDKAFGH